MILVEQYDNDYVKDDLVIKLGTIVEYKIYEGTYKNIRFEIKDALNKYPEIFWIGNYKVLGADILKIEESIIVDFIKNVHNE